VQFFILLILVSCSKEIEPAKKSVVVAAPIPVATLKPAPKARSWKDAYESVTPITDDNVEGWRDMMETEIVNASYDEEGNEYEDKIPACIEKGAKITPLDVVDCFEARDEGYCVADEVGCHREKMIQKGGVWYFVTYKDKYQR
jgi:hypothetical protein